jgi:hypothetical protein
VATLALGQACRRLARKHRAVSAKSALEKDPRPPIVYLRSFQDDGLFQPGTFFLVNDWLRTLNEKTPEESLATQLAPFGPVVACGRPEEEMPEVGAARIYVDYENWHELVLDLLTDRGALAILQAGATRGLRWEMEMTALKLRPDQILMFLPFNLHWSRSRRRTEFAAFRAWAAECFPATLPEYAAYDGVYYFYFTDKPELTTLVLDPSARIPKAHPLREVLKDLQASKALQPWRLVNLRRLFKLWLGGLLLFLIAIGIRFLANPMGNESPPKTSRTTTKQVDPKTGGQPKVDEQGDEKRVRYKGTSLPYHITLGPGWVQNKGEPDEEPSFSHAKKLKLDLAVSREREDLKDAPTGYVAGLRKATTDAGKPRFGKVTLLEERKVPLGGRQWTEFTVELSLNDVKIRQRVRCYSGREGTFFLIATIAENDPALDEEVTQVFDSFELPDP